jgi:hypothetical protein
MKKSKKPSKAELDHELDDALKATFPASDPIAVGEIISTKPDRPAGRMPPKIDKSLVEEMARNVARRHTT